MQCKVNYYWKKHIGEECYNERAQTTSQRFADDKGKR
jgi:hypothetical protein